MGMSLTARYNKAMRDARENRGVKKIPTKITDEQVRALNNGTGAVMFRNGKAILIKKKPKK